MRWIPLRRPFPPLFTLLYYFIHHCMHGKQGIKYETSHQKQQGNNQSSTYIHTLFYSTNQTAYLPVATPHVGCLHIDGRCPPCFLLHNMYGTCIGLPLQNTRHWRFHPTTSPTTHHHHHHRRMQQKPICDRMHSNTYTVCSIQHGIRDICAFSSRRSIAKI